MELELIIGIERVRRLVLSMGPDQSEVTLEGLVGRPISTKLLLEPEDGVAVLLPTIGSLQV